MKEHQTKCKICQKPLYVEVDEAYPEDIYKLLPMATCNRCYDLRARRERLHDGISRVCLSLAIMAGRINESDLERYRRLLTALTQKYAKWMGDFHQITSESLWQPDFVDLLVNAPAKWNETLSRYRAQVRAIAAEAHAKAETAA